MHIFFKILLILLLGKRQSLILTIHSNIPTCIQLNGGWVADIEVMNSWVHIYYIYIERDLYTLEHIYICTSIQIVIDVN